MARQTQADRWQEIASARLGEPVIASVILMRKGSLRSRMLGGINPIDGVLGGVVDAVVDAGASAVKQQLARRDPIKSIDVDNYAYLAVGATKVCIIKPAEAMTTTSALKRGKIVVLVPRSVPIKLTPGHSGFFFRAVTLDINGYAPIAFQANRRNWRNLQKVAAALL